MTRTASTLSVSASASAAQVAHAFALSAQWVSSEPSIGEALSSSPANSTRVFELLQQGWNATGSELTNAMWAADPFDGGNSNAVLQVQYPDDSRTGAQFSMKVFGQDELVQTALLKYEVAFDSSFDFVKGGKLPGLYGASPDATGLCSGGEHLEDCFSARLMWRERGAGEVYAYIPTYDGFCGQSDISCNDEYGTSLSRGTWRFPRGGWTTITQLVSLNTPGMANGLLFLWANDSLALAHTGIAWRTNASVTLTSIFFSTFFGGSDDSYNSGRGESSYFRRFEVYTSSLASNTSGPAVIATPRLIEVKTATGAVADNVPETVPTLSQAKANTASASSATGYSQDQRASPAPELPIFVLQSPSQMVATVAHSSGLPRRAIARVDAVVNPAQDPATSGVVSFVCKSIGLLVTLVVTAVVVFLASGPGL
ncbi:hypothetical protein JCM3770_005363 [Rhodotorula araucariae]